MNEKKSKSYTLVEMVLTLVLVGVIVFGCAKIRFYGNYELHNEDYLAFFLKVAPWVRKSETFKWDGENLCLQLKKKINDEEKCVDIYVKVTNVKPQFKRRYFQMFLPSVATTEWKCWRKKKKSWQSMRLNKIYTDIQALKVTFVNDTGKILERFLFVNYAN